jgi:hypothetical protein
MQTTITSSRCFLKATPESRSAKPAFDKIQLIDGHWYEGTSQESKYAYWDVSKQRFIYVLERHGICFAQEIGYSQDNDLYDTFCPKVELPFGRLPKDLVEAGYAELVKHFSKPTFEVPVTKWH